MPTWWSSAAGSPGVTTALRLQEAGRPGRPARGRHHRLRRDRQQHREGHRAAEHDAQHDRGPPRRRRPPRSTPPPARRRSRTSRPAREGIDCDLERRPAVTYAATPDELETVADELTRPRAGRPRRRVARRGRRAAVRRRGRGVAARPGLRAPGPLRARTGAGVRRAGGTAYEHSRVLTVDDGSPCRRPHRAGDGARGAGRDRHALPDPRPRSVLRAPEGPALVLRRGAHRRRAAGGDGDQRRLYVPFAAVGRRCPHRRRRGPLRRRRRTSTDDALRAARGVRARPLGRGRARRRAGRRRTPSPTTTCR